MSSFTAHHGPSHAHANRLDRTPGESPREAEGGRGGGGGEAVCLLLPLVSASLARWARGGGERFWALLLLLLLLQRWGVGEGRRETAAALYRPSLVRGGGRGGGGIAESHPEKREEEGQSLEKSFGGCVDISLAFYRFGALDGGGADVLCGLSYQCVRRKWSNARQTRWERATSRFLG